MSRFHKLRWVLAGACIAVVSGATTMVVADATSTSPAFYGCLKSGLISNVATKTHSCPAGFASIHWSVTGPQGNPGAAGPGAVIRTAGAPSQYIVPSGIHTLEVKLWGGGGGGGAGNGSVGGGGASGSYADALLPVTPGEVCTVTSGAGGVAQASNATGDGADGADSSVSCTISSTTTLIDVGGGAGGKANGQPGASNTYYNFVGATVLAFVQGTNGKAGAAMGVGGDGGGTGGYGGGIGVLAATAGSNGPVIIVPGG